jgi:hypothetical protein
VYDSQIEIAFVIDVLNTEIEFAESQLQPHDTGHINTAISWMTHRKKELEKEYSLLSSAG